MDKRLTIGVLIGNTNSPYSQTLVEGIHRGACNYDVSIIYFPAVHNTYANKSSFGEKTEVNYDAQNSIVYDYAIVSQLDAIVIDFGPLSIFMDKEEQEELLKKFSDIPYVLIGEQVNITQASSIITDNYQGMADIVRHLICDQGYQKITYLAGPKGNPDAQEREQAVWDLMEQYQIPFDQSHIEYGDFSDCVEKEILALLERYPDMEAMICANDLMADTVYRVCEEKGIVIGKDLAVTGYDDWENAISMNPPLTTVVQNAKEIGYLAIQAALKLLQGGEPEHIVVPARVKIRQSSQRSGKIEDRSSQRRGNYSFDGEEKSREELVREYLQEIMFVDIAKSIRKEIEMHLNLLVDVDLWTEEKFPELMRSIRILYNGELSTYISGRTFLLYCEKYLNSFLKEALTQNHELICHMGVALKLLENVRYLYHGKLVDKTKDHFFTFQKESWFIPLISRGMMEKIEDERSFFESALPIFPVLDIHNAALLVLENPVKNNRNKVWIPPEKLYLVSLLQEDQIQSWSVKDAPVINKQRGVSSIWKGNKNFEVCVFGLYCEETQYGFLALEINPEKLSLAYMITMQIANSMKFYILSKAQRETQKELERLIQEVREKNEVLNFISEYDQMTNCLNRRGFMERAMEYCKMHPGEKATLFFADLDHLKEINDTFGHGEGDFAIKRCADVLLMEAGDDGIIGRIGGDEFVVIKAMEEKEDHTKFMDRVRERNHYFNLAEVKPYYIDLSMGYHEMVCDQNFSLMEVMNKADESLYQAKKERRKTIIK